MRVLLVAILLTSNAFSMEGKFNPLATLEAKTNDKGKFSLTRSQMGNINSSMFVSSLSFTPIERLELGFIPFFYLDSSIHKYNFSVKWNFWRDDIFDWSLLYSRMVLRSEMNPDGYWVTESEVELPFYYVGFVTNVRIPDSRYSLGFTMSRVCGEMTFKNSTMRDMTKKCLEEYGVDLQIKTFENQSMTLGHGQNRESGLSPYEGLETGYGAIYSWFRAKKFFSRPSIGYYYSPKGHSQLILTTTFYEI